ncbi:MAG: FecR domain-containing protein [Pseudomonadota bacterium]
MYCLIARDSQQKRPVAIQATALAAIFLIAPAAIQAQNQTRPSEPSLPYTVKSSDKLIRLSREMLVSTQAWNEVAKYNQLKDPDLIFPGQKLDIPLRYLKSKPSTGKVISAEGEVTLGGNSAQPGAAIGDGSQLKTGANSSAVIELGDGSRVKILPNSLAEVVTNRDYALRDASASGSTNWFSGLMRLSAGALETLASKTAKRATPLQIETPTSLVGVRGTEFRVAFDDPVSRSARTEVVEGKVRADNPAQQSGADLPTGTGALVNPLEKEVKVVVLLPAPDLANIPTEVLKPLGGWAMPVLDGAVAYRVQVSSDEKFDKIVRDLKVAGNSADLASLANGNWFARVRGIDPAGLEGFDAVKLIAVRDGQWRVSYSSMSLVNGQAVLSWIGQQSNGQPMTGGSYSALVARDEALTQVVANAEREVPGRGPRLELGDLKPGVYFIRLRSKPAQGGATDSEIYRFEIPANWGKSVFDQTSSLQAVK